MVLGGDIMKFHCKYCDTKLFVPDEKLEGKEKEIRCRVCKGVMKARAFKIFPYFPIHFVEKDIFGMGDDTWPRFDDLVKVEDFPQPLGGELPLRKLQLLH